MGLAYLQKPDGYRTRHQAFSSEHAPQSQSLGVVSVGQVLHSQCVHHCSASRLTKDSLVTVRSYLQVPDSAQSLFCERVVLVCILRIGTFLEQPSPTCLDCNNLRCKVRSPDLQGRHSDLEEKMHTEDCTHNRSLHMKEGHLHRLGMHLAVTAVGSHIPFDLQDSRFRDYSELLATEGGCSSHDCCHKDVGWIALLCGSDSRSE